MNSELSWSKTAGTALDRQDQENHAIIWGRLIQTDLLYIFDFFILSTQKLSKYTTIDVSSRLCIFRYLFLLSMSCIDTIHCSCICSFISHSCFIKINNQASSGNGFNFTKLHPDLVASSIKQCKQSKCESMEWSLALAQVVVAADVTASPFNWHLGPFPVRPVRVER